MNTYTVCLYFPGSPVPKDTSLHCIVQAENAKEAKKKAVDEEYKRTGRFCYARQVRLKKD